MPVFSNKLTAKTAIQMFFRRAFLGEHFWASFLERAFLGELFYSSFFATFFKLTKLFYGELFCRAYY